MFEVFGIVGVGAGGVVVAMMLVNCNVPDSSNQP